MDLLEFLVFMVGMIFMTWMSSGRAKKSEVDFGDDEEEEQEEEREIVTPKIVIPKRIHTPKALIEEPQLQSTQADSRAYSLVEKPSRLKKMVKKLGSKKQLIIINELIGKPKGFQE